MYPSVPGQGQPDAGQQGYQQPPGSYPAPGYPPGQPGFPQPAGYGQSYPAQPSFGQGQPGYGAPGQFPGGGFAASAPGQEYQQPAGFMPSINPMNSLGLMAAGSSLLSGGQNWGQQYYQRVQQKMGWLSVGAMSFHFSVTKQYVLAKLFMLFAPYLKRWTFTRQPEQIQGGQKYRPPAVDVNCPDLYIPLMGMWTYCMLVCLVNVFHHTFKPDLMYSTVWSASMAWTIHLVLVKLLLRSMNLPMSVPWVDMLAYTGYTFVPVCCTIISGFVLGRWGYWCAWAYGSLCAGIFLVRTMKRIIFQETGHYGRDLTVTNYLLLSLALLQFPFTWWLGIKP